jgi:RHS repeat-associated protein
MRRAIVALLSIAFLVCCSCFLFPPKSLAQNPAQGAPMYGSFDGSNVARVNLQNLNATMVFPLAGSRGRGLSASFSISYNSSLWSKASAWSPVFDKSGAASWGWNKNHFMGWVDYQVAHAHCTGDPVGLNLGTTTYSNFSYMAPNRTRHPFSISYHVPGDCGGTAGGTYTGYATDGSGYYIDANQTLVRDRSGLTITSYGNGLEDTNGNLYSSSVNFNSTNGQTTTTWTDSRGKTALLLISPNPTNTQNDSYSYYDSTGTLRTVSLQNQTLNIATNFACSGVTEYSGTAKLPTAITLANGQSYTISYEPTPGISGKYTGRIQQITLPAGGYVQFTYGGSNDGINCADGSTLNLTIVRSDGSTTTTTQYSRAQVGTVWQTTITYPQLPYDAAANQVVLAFDGNGHETSRMIYQGSATGNPLRTINTSWTSTGTITPASQTVVLEDGNTAAQTDTSYDPFGNLLSTSEHDWGTVGAPGPVIRTTTLTYLSASAYTNLNILNRVTTKTVADGGGVVHSREDIAYDGTSLSPCPAGVVQHDDTNYGCSMLTRGNPTSVTTYTDAATPAGAIAKNFHYDIFGNLAQADLDCCQSKTWAFSAATQYAFPDSITRGSSPGTQLTTSATYNAADGSVATSTDENGKVTSYAYDSMGRVLSVTRPDTTQITYTYDDAHNSVSVSTPIQGTSARQTKSTYDGLGRTVKQTILDASNTSYSIVEAQFDPLGRAYKVSNPHNSTAQYWTESRFDALGRSTLVIPPDGSAAANRGVYSYSGATATITDPAGKTIKHQVDGLGRLSKVFEPDVANGNSLTQETDLSYSATGDLRTVTQGLQTRNYTYDDMGRLLTAKTPETNQVAATYAYNSFNLVSQRTDARGVVTTYSYDNLNRLTQVSYNVGTTGVPATPTVTMTYDEGGSAANAQGRLTTLTDGTGTEQYTYNNLGLMTQLTKTVGGTQYPMGYAYNLAGELTSLTYPSARIVQENYDAIGRLCAVGSSGATCATGTNYVSGLSYNTAQQVTGFSYGNGVAATVAYSPDRLQMQALSYAKGPQTLASWNYWYKTDATNCPGAPAGNNGQTQCITDNVDSGRSVAYAYDALYRLSSAVTNGSASSPQWGLSWTYDRYGNRTAQSIASGCTAPMSCPTNSVTVDAATNRISGSPYAYDLNGNMTNDGANALTYDAENHAVAAAGWNYVYDGNGLRVRKCAPNCASPTSSTLYIFSGSKVIAEYDNGAAVGSPSREYVYAGASLVAKFEGGATTYFHQDHLSNRLLTDSSGNVAGQRGHFPFGESWYESGTTTKLTFTSYERDSETGNDFAMARYGVNRLGRFSSPDRVAGSAAIPQTLNAFSYVQNDPVNLVDPSGLLVLPGGGIVDASGAGGLWGEFDVTDIPVRIGTNYHFETISRREFPWDKYDFEELMRFARQGELNLTTSPIYGFPIILGPGGGPGGGGGGGRPTEKNPPKTRNTPKDWIEEAWRQYQDCVRKGNQGLSRFLPPPVNRDTLVGDAARDAQRGMRPNVPGLPNGGNMPTHPGGDLFEGILQFVADTKRGNIKADCLKKYPEAALSPSYSGEV